MRVGNRDARGPPGPARRPRDAEVHTVISFAAVRDDRRGSSPGETTVAGARVRPRGKPPRWRGALAAVAIGAAAAAAGGAAAVRAQDARAPGDDAAPGARASERRPIATSATGAPRSGSARTRAAAPQATPQEEARARARFADGATAYDAGDYEVALEAFSDAYALSGRPQLLHNMYLCAERLGRPGEAASYLRRYLLETPDVENRAALEVRLGRLDERAAREAREREAASGRAAARGEPGAAGDDGDAESARASAAAGPGALPVVLVAGGAAVAVAGGALLGVAAADVAAVEDPPPGTRWAEVEAAYERSPALSGAGIAALGLGAVLAGLGVVWLATASGDGERPAAAPKARLGVGPGGVRLWGTF
jgi:tetratricopeptide (TPR) repeat protein